MAQETGKLPPLIDREIFFGDPEIAGAQLSPDGKHMSFLKPHKGVRNIWVKVTDAPFETARPITADTTRPISGYFWSRDSKYILYVQDKGGNENFHVYAVDPEGKAADGADVPEARNLTPVESVRAAIYSVPKSDPDMLYVGMNDRDPSWHDLYSLKISTGELTLIKENTDRISGWEFDLADKLRLAYRSTDDGGTEILRVEDDKFVPCYSCTVEESCYVYRFHKNGKQAYMVTNKGEDLDLTQLMLFDPATGEATLLESDPEKQVDLGGAFFSKVTDELVATIYIGDKPRYYFKDKELEADYNFVKSKLPGVEIGFGSSTEDEQLWLVSATSDTDPGATYLFDRKKKELTFQYRPRPKLPVEHLANMKPVRYKSTDGLEIPAYLTLPKGLEAKNLPAVIMVHGGPWARDYWGYDAYAQFLANRGYAVLQPNFRASTGFGKAFLNAGNGKWGETMQDDVTAGVKYLIDSGIADPKRVGIFGGSYGGYATLAGLAFTPDVYAAGVSLVGPSNLITLLESLPPYWEAGRKMFYKRVGDPTTEEGKAKLMKQSPLFSAEKIKAPLLVVQGANDPRVKQAESDQIVVAMRDLGRPVEYMVAPDEGHGFAKPENQLAFMAAAEKFMAKHLGGRYQEEVTPGVQTRLEAMRVDVATVTLKEKAGEDVVNAPLPEPEADLKPAVYNYKMVISVGGQEIPMDVKRTVTEEDGHWMVTDFSATMMGNVEDKSLIQKGTLLPVKREVSQGPVRIVLNHTSEKITGTVSMNGNEQPVDVELEAPVFGDGAALNATLATLPLKVGYETVYRTFDVQTQKVRPFSLKVISIEQVETPAGKFETFKVEIDPLDESPGEQTSWITTADGMRCVVKTSATMPQMGGATVVVELVGIEGLKD